MEGFFESVDFIREKYSGTPELGIILGTGLGGLVREICSPLELSYRDIPHFPVSTVETHAGKLIFGQLAGKETVVMQGRFHFYEGYSMQQIVYPVRIMKLLGIKTLFISNVAGGINTRYRKGDMMILDDHINMQSANPLTGKNLDVFGPRFPDMCQPYASRLIDKAWEIAHEESVRIHKGVYAAVNGPNLETRAEYRFLGKIGADAVGMSTVPEVIAAKHAGLEVFAISLITDECDPDYLQPVSVSEIIEVASASEPKLTRILSKMASFA